MALTVKQALEQLAQAFAPSNLKQLQSSINRDHSGALVVQLDMVAESPGVDGNPPVTFKGTGRGKSVAEAMAMAAKQAKDQGMVCAVVGAVAG